MPKRGAVAKVLVAFAVLGLIGVTWLSFRAWPRSNDSANRSVKIVPSVHPANSKVGTPTQTPAQPNPPSFKKYEGVWRNHTSTLVIKQDGSALYTWNAGPCVTEGVESSPMCSGHGELKLVQQGKLIAATYVAISYTEQGKHSTPPGFHAPEGDPKVGDTHSSFILVARGVLKHTDPKGGRTYYSCKPTASKRFRTECNF